MATKASKDSVIDGQQRFFEDLNQVESEVDKKRDELIMEEFKRLGDKLVAENTQLDSRVSALEKKADDSVMRKLLDQKLDKDEFSNFVSMLNEETISPMQKEIDKSKKDIQCIEVSGQILKQSFRDLTCFFFQSFLENLSQAIKALEQNVAANAGRADPDLNQLNSSMINFKMAAGRQKSLDPQNCLSCGEFELSHI